MKRETSFERTLFHPHVTLECTSNLTSVTWQTWLTTNSPTGLLRLTDSRANTNRNFFYRARNGS
jgi:hypothetical protein